MKKIIYIIVALFLIQISHAQLSVEKLAQNTNISVDSELQIQLKFKNQFGKEVPIEIKSKDIVGGNGFDVECYEFMLPKEPEALLQLSAITAYEPGNFTLEKAQITYINPDTNQEGVVESNTLDITVNPSGSPSTVTTQSITSVYNCDGQSYTSSQTTQTNSGQQQQQEQQQEQKEEEQTQKQLDEMQQKMNQVQNNQMSQDTQALKQQMQEDMQKQQQMEQELDKAIKENEDFQEMQKELQEKGYQESGKNLDAENNNSGEFEYEYKNEQGQTAEISGEMKDGEMQDIQKEFAQDSKNLQDILEKDPRYQEMEKELSGMGFNKTDFSYEQKENITMADVEFENEEGEKAEITATIKNETVTDIDLEKPVDKKKQLLLLLIIISLLLAALSFWYFLKKRQKKEEIEEKKIIEKPFDFKKEANKLLEKAEDLFKRKRYKDAYGKASEGLRLYFSHKYEVKKELTATDTINLLKKRKKPFSKVQKCLNLCGLVEFAKYKPNKKDFDTIIELARKEIN